MRPASQRDRMIEQLSQLDTSYLSSRLLYLDEILGESQNRPPEGASDLTISEAEWDKLRDICDSLKSLITNLTHFGV